MPSSRDLISNARDLRKDWRSSSPFLSAESACWVAMDRAACVLTRLTRLFAAPFWLLDDSGAFLRFLVSELVALLGFGLGAIFGCYHVGISVVNKRGYSAAC